MRYPLQSKIRFGVAMLIAVYVLISFQAMSKSITYSLHLLEYDHVITRRFLLIFIQLISDTYPTRSWPF